MSLSLWGDGWKRGIPTILVSPGFVVPVGRSAKVADFTAAKSSSEIFLEISSALAGPVRY